MAGRLQNERITEGLVRDAFRQLGFFDQENGVTVEEQRSGSAEIRRLLSRAGKRGRGGSGQPEFICTSVSVPDLVVVVECKPNTARHASPGLDSPADFAVDGALHYAKALSAKFHVVALGVSGQTSGELKVSTYLHSRDEENPKELRARGGSAIDRILSFADYVDALEFDPAVETSRISDLVSFSRDLHNFMRKYAKVTESEKPLLVSGTLIALRNRVFARTYREYTPQELQRFWIRTIEDELQKADLPKAKYRHITVPYASLGIHAELSKSTDKFPLGILRELISRLAEKVLPLMSVYQDFDVVGQFYGEFLKYSGGDGKGLGIVLTPRHITELFTLLANVNKSDVVLDPCAGTGGFLIAAMARMMQQASTEDERDDIRKKRLVGVEQQSNMFALCASNMIFRGDGKANLYHDDCFNPALSANLRSHGATVGLVNPPYSQEGDHELKFVQRMLDLLEPGGTGIAIVPMSCANVPSAERTNLLKHHTLEAVMSMPEKLFPKVGTIPCIMVFTAHRKHEESNKKTWFGFWKDDGFESVKNQGRADVHGTWPEIRDRWVSEFRNREVHPGRSVAVRVTDKDEWCAESYMETDYTSLTERDFQLALRDYAVFLKQQKDIVDADQ